MKTSTKKVLAVIAVLSAIGGTLFYFLKAKPCDEGTTKCIGLDLYECQEGKWVLIEENAEECGYEPPPTVSGTIKDVTTGHTLSGVEVTARHTATGIEGTTFTDENGYFKFYDIPTGSGSIYLVKQGYEPREYTNIGLRTEIILSMMPMPEEITATIIAINPEVVYSSGMNFLEIHFTWETTGPTATFYVSGLGLKGGKRWMTLTKSAGTHQDVLVDAANQCDDLNKEGWHTVSLGIEIWTGDWQNPLIYDSKEETFDIYTPQTSV